MRGNAIETLVGALVLIVAAVFAWFGYGLTNQQVGLSYPVTAQFQRIDGVSVGTEVRISGIRVGTVNGLTLDPDTYLANIALDIQSKFKIPTDSVLEVSSDGLLGGRYLNIVPGDAEEMIKSGGRLKRTQAPVDIVQLLGRFVFSAANGSQGGGATPTTPAPTQPPPKSTP